MLHANLTVKMVDPTAGDPGAGESDPPGDAQQFPKKNIRVANSPYYFSSKFQHCRHCFFFLTSTPHGKYQATFGSHFDDVSLPRLSELLSRALLIV